MNDKWQEAFHDDVPASFEARMRSTLASLEDGEEKLVRYRRRWNPAALVAAVLLVAVLAGSAFAADLFGLRSLIVTDPYLTVSATDAPPESDLIALQGIPESPEFRANAEWMDALAAYRTQLPPAGWRPTHPYDLYSVFNPTLQAALDDITARYGLTLHRQARDFYDEQALYELLGCGPIFSKCAALSGYVYEDGSFRGDGTSVDGICYEYQFGRYVKGTFSEVTLHIGDPDNYEEWLYTTAKGVTVQLSLGPDRCVLMADLPDSFVAVNLLGGTRGSQIFMPDPVTRERLETFAELFDFSALG